MAHDLVTTKSSCPNHASKALLRGFYNEYEWIIITNHEQILAIAFDSFSTNQSDGMCQLYLPYPPPSRPLSETKDSITALRFTGMFRGTPGNIAHILEVFWDIVLSGYRPMFYTSLDLIQTKTKIVKHMLTKFTAIKETRRKEGHQRIL